MKIGITAGAFDLLHTGHILFLENCKFLCDKLVVLLHTTPHIERPTKNKPCETTYERAVRLSSCKWVDAVIPYDTEKDLINILLSHLWDVRFLDSNYSNAHYTGKGIGKVVYIPRKHSHSSTELRSRIANLHNPEIK